MKNKLKDLILSNKPITSVIISALLTSGLVYFLGLLWTQNYLLLGIIWFGLYRVVLSAAKNISLRRTIFSLVFSVPFSFLLLLGYKISYPDGTFIGFRILDLVSLASLFGIFFASFIALLGFIDKKAFSPKALISPILKKHSWIIFSGIIFICWLPLLLSYFPGGVSVDSAVEIRQAIGESAWSNWHPVLHVAFLAIVINPIRWLTGSLTVGIAGSVIVQMVLFALILGYVAKWIITETHKKYLGYLILAFFSLCPIIACYSVTIWKDILFSGIFLLLFVKLYELVKYSRRKNITFRQIIPVLVFSILTAFLRNGGVLIILAIGILLIIYFRQSRKILALSFSVAILFTGIIQGPVYGLLNITGSPFMESMSIPAQQIAYVVKYGDVREDEYEKLSELVNPTVLADTYEPMNGDPAKSAFYATGTVENKKGDFLKLWFSLLTHNFWNYVKAYILHTYSYWYIQGPSWAIDLSHVHDDLWMQADFEDYKLLGEEAYKITQAVEIGNSKAIWGSWMASVGFMYWWVLVSVIVFIYQKRYKMLIPLSGVLIYMALLLVASPISWIFRYVFSLLLILPITTVLYFINPKERKSHD